jgi:uncharacterized protein DUF4214
MSSGIGLAWDQTLIYSAVHECKELRLDGATLYGLAYPKTGPHCCAINLVSDGRIVGAVRADQFSKFAADSDLRDGWCAFHLELAHDHFIFSDQLVLQCMVSRNVLHIVEFDAVPWGHSVALAPQSVPVALSDLTFRWSASVRRDIHAYHPLIERIVEPLNDEQYVNFAFRFILARDPDDDGRGAYLSSIRATGDRKAVLLALWSSDEFAERRRGYLPSPFDEAFPAIPIFLPLK